MHQNIIPQSECRAGEQMHWLSPPLRKNSKNYFAAKTYSTDRFLVFGRKNVQAVITLTFCDNKTVVEEQPFFKGDWGLSGG